MFVATDTSEELVHKYITAEDLQAYGQWCTPNVLAFNPIPNAPLYHYTTGPGLIKIIRSGELWATQLACLNDASELLYPIELLHEKVRVKLKQLYSDDVQFLLNKIDAGLQETQVSTEGRFIACFSEDGDDLSQWRAYGGGEGGYAIAFDSQYLRKLAHQFMILGKVEYDEEKQGRFFDDALAQITHFFMDGIQKKRAPSRDEWASEFLTFWAGVLLEFAPFIKHPRFKGEQEWRLVYHLQDDAIPRKQYLQRSSMMTQHVPLQLKTLSDRSCLPLTGVVIGPCRHKEISKISVGDLLRTHGYSNAEVPVTMTKIPYRTV